MEDVLSKAHAYEQTYRIIGRAHYIAAERYASLNRVFGVPVIVITAVVGTSIFGTITDANPSLGLRVATGLVSLAGTVLSALQTSLGFAQTAAKHKAAGEAYRGIRRRFEMFCLRHAQADSGSRMAAITALEALVGELASLPQEFPTLPDHCYEKAVAENRPNTSVRAAAVA